eukprot:UN10661
MCLYSTQGTIPNVDDVWLVKKNCNPKNTGYYSTDKTDGIVIASPKIIVTILILVTSFIIILSLF